MSKSKFRFNPDTLSYDKINISWKVKLRIILGYFTAILLIAVIVNVVYSFVFDTPEEKGLKRENNLMKLQYELLSKQLDTITNVIKDIEQRDDNIYRVIFNAEPIHSSIRNAGYGGVNRYAEFSNYEIVMETAKKIDQITKRVYVQTKSYDEVINLAINKEEMNASLPAIQPISNMDLTRMASGFGFRIDPFYKVRKFHYGMDFTTPTGTEIYATGDGIILEAKWNRGGYGNRIIIDHGFGYQTLYAHLVKYNVYVGKRVKRGEVIGYVGSTGKSTAPHFHYEVILNNIKINPVNFFFNDLTPDQYEKMIQLAANSGQSFD